MRNVTFVIGLLIAAALSASEPGMTQPKYWGDNQLIRPAGYRAWIFVGSSLGMGYQEAKQSGVKRPQQFHNIYIQRRRTAPIWRRGNSRTKQCW